MFQTIPRMKTFRIKSFLKRIGPKHVLMKAKFSIHSQSQASAIPFPFSKERCASTSKSENRYTCDVYQYRMFLIINRAQTPNSHTSPPSPILDFLNHHSRFFLGLYNWNNYTYPCTTKDINSHKLHLSSTINIIQG